MAIWDWVRVWKHLPWIFHLVGMFLSLVSIKIQFLFYFHVLHVIFIKIMAKIKELIFLSTGHPPWYIIIAISLSRLVLFIVMVVYKLLFSCHKTWKLQKPFECRIIKLRKKLKTFDNKFITKKSLKLHLNLSWFKLCTISPKKRQFILVDTYSSRKDTFKTPSWKAFWDWVCVWKHLAWIFHLVDLFLSLVSIIIQFVFFIFMSFMWFSSK